jgi:hypothetical protein
MSQSNSIGDAIIVCALTVGVLGYLYLQFREKQRYLDILHQERLAAIDKDIPLPELPIEPLFARTSNPPDPQVASMIGVVLLCFGVGSMLMLWLMPAMRNLWAAPIPVAFIGGGLIFASAMGPHAERGR